MRPFSTFSVKPFLELNSEAQQFIQARYIKLSALTHPDRFVSASEADKERVETASARLNSDYRKLKDFWTLMDSVASELRQFCPIIHSQSRGLASILGAQYFELQEKCLETPRDPALKVEIAEFRNGVMKQLHEAELDVKNIAKKYPFSSVILSSEELEKSSELRCPSSDKEIVTLIEAMDRIRYLRNFIKDLELQLCLYK